MKKFEDQMQDLYDNDPVKLTQVMLLAAAKSMIETNAESIDVSQESTLNEKRYKVKAVFTITEINQ